MAAGIEVFKEHFTAFQDQYILIGGMACDLLLNEAGIGFRPTKDIDMVLVIEALTTEFATAFWKFIEDGKYQARQRSSGKREFYRFVEPQTPGYPVMIELFARPGSDVEFSYSGHLVPLHISDEISSLSAILLNDAYYQFLLSGRTVSDGVSVLDAVHLVPMKMKAWLDLMDKKAQGFHVNDRDIRKHRQDIFRLFPLISPDANVIIPPEVYHDIERFIDVIREMPFDPKQIGINRGKDEVLDLYGKIYVSEDHNLTVE